MRNKVIFSLAIIGLLAGLVAAFIFGMERKAQPPVFQPATSPYVTSIFANGIIESDQTSGSNINVYPEVSGPVVLVLVKEGQTVVAGAALLNELKAEPRKETLDIARAQVDLASANVPGTRLRHGLGDRGHLRLHGRAQGAQDRALRHFPRLTSNSSVPSRAHPCVVYRTVYAVPLMHSYDEGVDCLEGFGFRGV